MLDTILADVESVFRAVFATGDLITLAIGVGVIVVFGFMSKSAGQAFNLTMIGLFVFAAGNYVRDVMTGAAPAADAAGGNRWLDGLDPQWNAFMDLPTSSFLAYFIVFFIAILVVHFIFGMLGSRD